jgi:hypothetical protein
LDGGTMSAKSLGCIIGTRFVVDTRAAIACLRRQRHSSYARPETASSETDEVRTGVELSRSVAVLPDQTAQPPEKRRSRPSAQIEWDRYHVTARRSTPEG